MERYGALPPEPSRHGLHLLHPKGISARLVLCPDSKSFSFYLIFKESLTNIIKHARAKKSGGEDGRDRMDNLVMSIEDDGEGFAAEGVVAGHYGTANIRARAEEMGAELRIDTIPQRGTRVYFSLPLDDGN